MKYYLVVGEASGDLHASNLMRALRKKDPAATFRYFGGDMMQSVGGTLVRHYRELSFMGFIPVLLHARTILKNMAFCKQDIARYRPDVVILVDYPGFNLKIARYVATELSVPLHYYISPKVWAWKAYRISSFKKYVSRMLCILPFEVDFFEKHQFKVDYVGNPTVDAIAAREEKKETFAAFTAAHHLSDRPVIALLAGSRKQEIAANLPSMLQVASSFGEDYQFIIAGAPGIEPSFYEKYTNPLPWVTTLFNRTYRILAQSEAALVTSGTATLETALLRVPQVVCYKMALPHLSYWAFQHLLHTPYISLVNLICGREVVKELFASRFSVENIRKELHRILYLQEYRESMLDNYDEMCKILGEPGASERAADIIYSAVRATPDAASNEQHP